MGSPLNDDFLHLLNGTPLPPPVEPSPPPVELAGELAEGSPRRAAILILARALTHRSGHPEQLDYTVASLSVQLERHLKTRAEASDGWARRPPKKPEKQLDLTATPPATTRALPPQRAMPQLGDISLVGMSRDLVLAGSALFSSANLVRPM